MQTARDPHTKTARGQAAGEFLTVLPFIFILFAVFLVIYYNQLLLLQQTQDRLDAQATGQRLANAINQVYLAGPGATYALEPLGSRFTLRIQAGFVELNGSRVSLMAYPLLTSRVSELTVGPGPLLINNTGDFVGISN